MTSSIPNRRYGDGFRRLGFSGDAALFFDEHVEADVVHENIAAVDLAGGLLTQEPLLGQSLLWGAETLVALEGRWASPGRPHRAARTHPARAAARPGMR